MQMYQIKVGNFTRPGTFSEMAAAKFKADTKHCFKNKIELIPIKQGVTV